MFLFKPPTRLRLAWFCFAVHLLAVAAMGLVLRNGLPPVELEERRAFVANHQAAWGVGWGLWMVAAVSLPLLFLAWLDTLAEKGWGIVGVALAFAGAAVDVVVELVAIFLAPQWAAQASLDPFFSSLYAVWEQFLFLTTSGLSNLLYALAGFVLTWVAWRTANFPRWLAGWGLAAWTMALLLSAVAFANQPAGPIVIFPLLFGLVLPWILLLGYQWLSKPAG